MQSFQTIQVSVESGVARVTINRPEALNALNGLVIEELTSVFGGELTRQGAKGVIITGAGEKAFVAGADIAQMKEMNAVQADQFCRKGQACMDLIQNFPGPVIAAVNGFALGGGLELALACDFIYAAKTAKLGLPEVNLGLFPGFGGTQRLPRVVGVNRAKELIFTADIITADEAHRIGLVTKLFEPADLVKGAEDTIKKILTKGPLAVRMAKRVVNEGVDLPLATGLALEAAQFPLTFATEDRVIGVTAFLEKKKAEFQER
jgi:enoyl-CoA hydratase